MKCLYYYNNKQFDSELGLDYYLYKELLIDPDIKDLVYSMPEKARAVYNKLKTAHNSSQVTSEYTIGSDGLLLEILKTSNPNSISVSNFISKIPNVASGSNLLVTPEFNSENYWAKHIVDWNTGTYSKFEIAVLGFDKDSGLIPSKEFNGNLIPIEASFREDSEQFKTMRGHMETIWRLEGEIGTAVHDLLSLAFYAERGYPLASVFSSPSNIVAKLQRLLEQDAHSKKLNAVERWGLDSEEALQSIAVYAYNLGKEICESVGALDLSQVLLFSEGGLVSEFEIDMPNRSREVGQLAGRMDLFAMNMTSGQSAVIDFKCSPAEVVDDVKELTYSYQLAIYRRMLELLHILGNNDFEKGDIEHCRTLVAPIGFKDFKYDRDTKTCSLTGIYAKTGSYLLDTLASTADKVRDLDIRERIIRNVNNVLPIKISFESPTEDWQEDIDKIQRRRFPVITKYKYESDEDIEEYIKTHGKIIFDKVTKKWVYRANKGSLALDISAEATDEAAAKVEIFKTLLTRLTKHTSVDGIKNRVKTLKRLIESSTPPNEESRGKFPTWLATKVNRYRNPQTWEIISFDKPTNDWLESRGYIMLRHKQSNQIDVLKVSLFPNLRKRVALTKTSDYDDPLLLGTYMSDEVQRSIPEELTLLSCFGNIELMEVMEVLNHFSGTFGFRGEYSPAIGHIEVINPNYERESITASNKQLLYNYSQLCAHDKVENSNVKNNFKGPLRIRLCSALELARRSLLEALEFSLGTRFKDVLGKSLQTITESMATTTQSEVDVARNREKLILDLLKIKEDLEKEDPTLRQLNVSTTTPHSQASSPAWYVHKYILDAILEQSQIPIRQQLEGSSNYVQGGLSFKTFFTKGWNGLRIDNPGTLVNLNLNEMTKVLNVAYQREREEALELATEVRERVERLLKSKSFNALSRYSVGNQSDLFENMFVSDENGLDPRLILRNPFDPEVASALSPEELDFLKFFLTIRVSIKTGRGISKSDRISEELLKLYLEQNSEEYLVAPLLAGGIGSSQVVFNSFFKAMKLKIKRIAKFAKDFADDLNGTYVPEKEDKINAGGELWEAANRYDIGDDLSTRYDYMESKGGAGYFDTNLEHLLLGIGIAKIQLDELNKVFPIIQAVSANLLMQSVTLNIDLSADILYICDFVKSKMFNRMIDSKTAGSIGDAVRDLRGNMSKLGLGFNIKQLYQVYDGIFKIGGLITRKPDGTSAFTLKNVVDAARFVASDLGHFGTGISMCESLNYTYGINDMDTNQLALKLSQDNVGLYNLGEVSMRMASRPDYYNRATMFVARMKADGCFDAHSFDGLTLKYNWKLDKRFSVFASGDTKHPEYKKLKGLYYEVCKQFIREGAMQPGDLDLENPKPLPRAYTVQEAESIKALADRMYGYYSHEKKSLIQSFTIGALFFQMNTFFSSLKNQYFSGRRYTLEGHYILYEEPKPGSPGETIKYYWKNVDGELVMQTEETDLPVMVWKGLPQEGIVITCARFLRVFLGKDPNFAGHGISGMKAFYAESKDPDVRLLYRSNIKQFLYDLFIFLLIGQGIGTLLLADWLDEARKRRGSDTLGDAALNNLETWQLTMLLQAASSYNGIGNVLGKGVEWTPYALTLSMNIVGLLSSYFSGDKDTFDLVMSIGAAPKQFKYLGDYVKMLTLGRHIGDNGEEDED